MHRGTQHCLCQFYYIDGYYFYYTNGPYFSNYRGCFLSYVSENRAGFLNWPDCGLRLRYPGRSSTSRLLAEGNEEARAGEAGARANEPEAGSRDAHRLKKCNEQGEECRRSYLGRIYMVHTV